MARINSVSGLGVSKPMAELSQEEAADNLHSRAFSQNVASDLADLFKSLQQGRFNYDDYRPLVLLVIQLAPDIEIWKAVLSLIAGFSRTTPPASIPPTFDGTPFRSTSSKPYPRMRSLRAVGSDAFMLLEGDNYPVTGGPRAKSGGQVLLHILLWLLIGLSQGNSCLNFAGKFFSAG
uniref:Uncharacterized protein n=1 Tax=Coccidioides posadasii RMSCC 3488 TaxID=454284 RepID=A0A0J6FCQ6_COCPO|nr:hypothetical protein CPAG_07137 [Coccidioides posadasii RMSCC 3488]